MIFKSIKSKLYTDRFQGIIGAWINSLNWSLLHDHANMPGFVSVSGLWLQPTQLTCKYTWHFGHKTFDCSYRYPCTLILHHLHNTLHLSKIQVLKKLLNYSKLICNEIHNNLVDKNLLTYIIKCIYFIFQKWSSMLRSFIRTVVIACNYIHCIRKC